jgi:hypothetical protein
MALRSDPAAGPLWTYGREGVVIPNTLYRIEEKDVIPPLCKFAASYHPQRKCPTTAGTSSFILSGITRGNFAGNFLGELPGQS